MTLGRWFEGLGGGLQSLLGRLRRSDQTTMIALAVLVGVGTGFGAVFFRWLISTFTGLFWNGAGSPGEVAASLPWWRLMLVPAGGGLLVGLMVQFYSREVKGHGVPEVMEAIVTREGKIRSRVVPGKALASAITIGTGGSAGREGPIVQIGSALGSVTGQLAGLSGQYLRVLVAAGAAGGISATFNTPVAGAIFAAEIILGDFGVSHFTPVVIGSVMATAVSRSFYGDQPTFHIPPDIFRIVSVWEFVPYALLGLFAAIVGLLFIRSLSSTVAFFDSKVPLPMWTRPAIGGLILGIAALFVPQVLGVGYDGIEGTLQQGTYAAVPVMLGILLAKIVATSLTLGSGGSGGVLSPSLFIGAMLGGAVGGVVHALAPAASAPAGAYALVGMGAVLAAATHAPLTAVLMLFELTGNYQIILPLMLACTLATLIVTRLDRASIYTVELLRRGLSFSHGFEVNVLRSIEVEEVYTPDIATVQEEMPLEDLIATVASSSHTRFFLLDEEGDLTGAVDLNDLRQVLPNQEFLRNVLVAADVANRDVGAVTRDQDLATVMRAFERERVDELPVIGGAGSRRLLGVVRKDDLIARYNREMLRKDMAQEVHVGMGEAAAHTTVRLDDSHLLAEIPVPSDVVGTTLGECGFRRNYGVEVVLVRPSGGASPRVPDGDTRLERGDVLLVMGDREAVGRLRARP